MPEQLETWISPFLHQISEGASQAPKYKMHDIVKVQYRPSEAERDSINARMFGWDVQRRKDASFDFTCAMPFYKVDVEGIVLLSEDNTWLGVHINGIHLPYDLKEFTLENLLSPLAYRPHKIVGEPVLDGEQLMLESRDLTRSSWNFIVNRHPRIE